MDHMVFGSMISLDDPCQYHICPVVWPIPFLSADKSIYGFGFVHHLLNKLKVLSYLARNLFYGKTKSILGTKNFENYEVYLYQPINEFWSGTFFGLDHSLSAVDNSFGNILEYMFAFNGFLIYLKERAHAAVTQVTRLQMALMSSLLYENCPESTNSVHIHPSPPST